MAVTKNPQSAGTIDDLSDGNASVEKGMEGVGYIGVGIFRDRGSRM